MRLPVLVSCLFGLSLLSLLGCQNPVSLPTGKVKGTVTYQGEPVESGLINFESDPPGHGAAAEINGGAFVVNGDVVHGSYVVTILPPPLPPPVPGETQEATEATDVPAKYQDAKTSGLTADVIGEQNEFTFELD